MTETAERTPPKLDAWTKTYSQDGDCWSSDTQGLIVEQNDGGGGPYWIITTERWAIDSIDELIELLTAAGVQTRAEQGIEKP